MARVVKATLADIQSLRALFLQETNCQIRYDACHARGWTDSYLLEVDDVRVGYGSVKGRERQDRDTIFEFFVLPPVRRQSRRLFAELIAAAGASYIECQSNDELLASLAFEFAKDINATAVLFEDAHATRHEILGGVVRRRREVDQVFEHTVEPVGDHVLDVGGEVVATGGFMLHYNPPFADLYMEVRPDRRRCGYGAFLVQEVKKACYLAGRVPAARCSLRNSASRATLLSAGFRVSGFLLTGAIRETP